MSERSKGFKIGAVSLFVGAIGLLSYVLMTNNDEGPGAVPVEHVDVVATPAPEQPTVINAQATEDPPPAAETPAESSDGHMTPEKVKKARSFMD